jgi:hypothetical protein
VERQPEPTLLEVSEPERVAPKRIADEGHGLAAGGRRVGFEEDKDLALPPLDGSDESRVWANERSMYRRAVPHDSHALEVATELLFAVMLR